MHSLLIFLYLQFIQSSSSPRASCRIGYGIDKRSKSSTKGQCIQCQSYSCWSCYDDAQICQECMNGYLDKNKKSKTYGKCIRCGEHCNYCNETVSCGRCTIEYGFDEKGQCRECEDPNCDYCEKSYKICTDCKSGFGVDLDSSSSTYGKCIKTKDITCGVPSSSDASKCKTCKTGYYNDGSKCTKCNVEEHCIDCSKSNYCTECEDGYYLYGGKCRQCTVENCKSCHEDDQCDECNNGFSRESRNQCLDTKIPNCSGLEEENICNDCNKGYGVDSNFQCKECQVNDCLYCSKDYTTCEVCKLGLLYNTKTKQCVEKCANEHCSRCNYKDNDECELCEDGYSGPNCEPCKVENCVRCRNSVDKCDKCEEGYYVKDSKCVPFTIQNCIEGDYYGYEECNKCAEGYTVNDGKCEKCENDECASCYSSSGICITCKNGLFADFSKGSKSYGYCHERADSGEDKDKSKLPLGAIIGIVVGCVVVVGLVVFLVVYFLKCRKQSVEASSSE